MRTLVALFVAVCVVSWGCCYAGVPQKMNYQGKLTDAAGKLVADGSYEMKFSICNAETDGDQRWTETWDESNGRVQVTNGLFNVILGTHNSINIVFDENYWLELQVKGVGGYEPLLPRQQIVSSAYSFRAEKADTAATAATADSVAAADISGSISGSQIADGAVTADKISPEAVTFIHRVPSVSGISPGNKDVGYSTFTATITGQNFQSASQAKIGSTELTGENVTSSSSLTADVPADLPAGSHDVAVSNINFDWGTGSALFTVNTPTPLPGFFASCKDILDHGGSTGDHLYTIDPDGAGPNAPFSAYCDMTADGGGWTLVVRIMGGSAHRNTEAVGTLSSPTQGETAKLDDTTINAVSTDLYRFQCASDIAYVDATQRDFNAGAVYPASPLLNRCSHSYSPLVWYDGFAQYNGVYCALTCQEEGPPFNQMLYHYSESMYTGCCSVGECNYDDGGLLWAR